MKSALLQLAILLLVCSVSTAGSISATKTIRSCEPGLHNQPNGPFALMLFCEDALATHLGVIYKENMSNPLDGAWNISDRFWQAGEWASDVTAYVWSSDGKSLFVSTSPIYGTGNVYQLDLMQRQHTVVFKYPGYDPEKGEEACIVEMTSLNETDSTVELQLTYCDKQDKETISVQY